MYIFIIGRRISEECCHTYYVLFILCVSLRNQSFQCVNCNCKAYTLCLSSSCYYDCSCFPLFSIVWIHAMAQKGYMIERIGPPQKTKLSPNVFVLHGLFYVAQAMFFTCVKLWLSLETNMWSNPLKTCQPCYSHLILFKLQKNYSPMCLRNCSILTWTKIPN